MHRYVSNVGLNRNSSKEAGLNEKSTPLAFKETGSARVIYRELPYQRVRRSHYQRLDKIKRSSRKP